jgi:creatinine amidohydrolase
MPICELAFATWEEVRDLDPSPSVAILPVGALEAHGPHLPLDTDVIIAAAMAREGARILSEAGHSVLLLPPLAYAPAPFAAGFPGTVSVRPGTLRALVEDIAASLAGSSEPEAGEGPLLVLANAHLDPTHVEVLRELAGASPRILFPDITRRRVAERLTEEFRSGACHAGRYETSIVLAAAPERVRDEARSGLPPVPHSLTDGIREGKGTFEEVGGPRAYFGDPAAATAEEGRRTIGVLGEILAETVTGELPA